jgi:DNA-damage-inducible protein D
MIMLEYSKWGNFRNVINKAKDACKGSDITDEEHFTDVGRVLKVGNDAKMEVNDIKLTRYACYLIAQNGDSRKKEKEKNKKLK